MQLVQTSKFEDDGFILTPNGIDFYVHLCHLSAGISLHAYHYLVYTLCAKGYAFSCIYICYKKTAMTNFIYKKLCMHRKGLQQIHVS